MRFGKKPTSYNLNVFNHEKEPLASVINILKALNWILARFQGKKATSEMYGYYTLANNVLIIAQSLKRGIQLKDYNMLECLFRQSAELLIICELIFTDIDDENLIKIVVEERLRLYGGYCIWTRMKQLEIEIDQDAHYTSKDVQSDVDSWTKEFIEVKSKELHHYYDLIGKLQLNAEKAQLDKRDRNGESLYSFLSAVDPSYSSTSDYIRKKFSPVSAAAYSKVSSRIHGTWNSIYPSSSSPNVLLSSLRQPEIINTDSIILPTLGNLEASMKYILRSFSFLWPELLVEQSQDFDNKWS